MKALTIIVLWSLAAFILADDTADVEVYTDYPCGLWAVDGTAQMDLSNTEQAHSFQKAIKVQMAAGTQLRVAHTWEGQSMANVAALEFWIYSTSYQAGLLRVTPYIYGNPRNTVPLSNFAGTRPNTWTRVRIPLSALQVQQTERMKELYFSAPNGMALPTFWLDDIKLVKYSVAQTHLSVNAGSAPIRTLDKKMFGIGTFTWDASLAMEETKQKMLEAGVAFMNFPGGTSADDYDWRNNVSVTTGAPGYIDTQRYLQIANDLGADKMLTVNYGSGTVQDAVDWVAFVNIVNAGDVIYWSIGNEVNQEDNPDLRPRPYCHDADTYARFVRDCIVLMKAVDPRIKIGVSGTIAPWDFPQRFSVTNPRTGQQENGWAPVMLSRLIQFGTLPDYYDFHVYPISPGAESDSALLQMGNRINFLLTLVRPMLTDYLGAAGADLPINVTETNGVWMPAGKQSTSLTTALYMADFWGNVSKSGLNAFVWWNLHNTATAEEGNFHPSLYGWRPYGTFGMLSMGLPEGVQAPLNTPYPTFYAYKLIKLFARPGDIMVPATTNNELLTIYASRSGTDSRLRLLVINKAKAQDISASLSISGYTVPENATVYRYGMPEDLQMQDITTSTLPLRRTVMSSSQTQNSLSFPRYSITVVEL